MIECRPGPIGCRMTRGAIRRETTRGMRRIIRRVKVRLMAAHACRRDCCIASVLVAIGTLSAGMRARQGEGCCVMIERPLLPCDTCMATLAGRRKPVRRMIGVGRRHKLRVMTVVALGGGVLELRLRMTLRARGRGVCSYQGKARHTVVKRTRPGQRAG